MQRRIIHLIETSGPGGGETVFVDLVSASADAGHQVCAVVPAEGWVAEALRSRGIAPVLLAAGTRAPRAFDLELLRTLRRLIREHHADLVHCHMLGMSVYAGLAALATRTPLIATLHGQVDLALDDPLRALKLRLVGRAARRVVVVSEAMRQQALQTTPWRADRVVVIHNGVDARALAAAAPEDLRGALGLAPSTFLFGALGNVREAKAYDDLLRAVALAHAQDPALHVAIVGQGGGALFASLCALRASLGLDGVVHFVGFQPDVGGVLQALDAFVLSSRTEGFSIATVQAMALGRAVVATRCGGPEEIITDGTDGLLVTRADPPALAAGMLRLMHDPALRARLGAAARATAQARFSLDEMCRRYLDLYDRCARWTVARHPEPRCVA